MTSEPNIAALSRALLRCEGTALLETRLDRLADHVEQESARAVFIEFHGTGAATTLRQALEDERLADWLDENCATREVLAVAYQLRVWLGITAPDVIALDDVARLADIDPLPFETKQLSRWAERHGMSGELIRPAIEVLLDPRACPDGVSVLDAAMNRDGEVGVHVQRAVRMHLQHEAAAVLGPNASERLWSISPPSAAMHTLAARLRPLLAPHSLALLCQVRFVPTRPVNVDPTTGRCRGVLLGKPFASAQLELGGYEQCALEGSCSECRDPGCMHVAALAARLLDACLDPGDCLQVALASFTRTPSWRRFLDAVSTATPASQEHAELISFVAARKGARVAIGARRAEREPKLAAPLRLLRSKTLDERDRGPLQSMARLARTRGAELVPADLELLRALIDHPRVTWHDGDRPVTIYERRLQLRLESHAQGVVPQLELLGRRVDAKVDDAYALMESADQRSLVFAAMTEPARRIMRALEGLRGALPPASYPELAVWLGSLREQLDLTALAAVSGAELPAPDKLVIRLQPLPDEGCTFTLCSRAFPLSPLWPPGEGDEVAHGMSGGRAVFCRRDLTRELELEAVVLERLELSKEQRVPDSGVYAATSDEDALALLERIARASDLVDIEWAEQGRKIRKIGKVRMCDLQIKLKAIGSAFRVEGSVAFEDAELSFRRLLEAAIEGHRFVKVDARDYVELEQDLIDRLRDSQYALNLSTRELQVIVSGAQTFLDALGEQVVPEDEPTRAWLELLRLPLPAAPELDAIQVVSKLRPYQRDGVRWLLRCSRWASGACLADEMGLGKTIQAIAVLQQRAPLGPALVVAPTSLSSNWRAELQRFAPELHAVVYRGAARRTVLEQLGPNVVLVTSYEIALRDRQQLAAHHFATHVIDEAQMLRNARTERSQAMRAIPADFRVALTGTPIENRIGDLWSLFQLIAPGMLGEWPTFRALVGSPLERERDHARAARLRTLIAPLILRRTKAEVAAELPERTEVVQRITLSPAERTLYNTAVKRARLALKRLKDEIAQHRHGDDKERDPRIQLLAELTRLRQLACHAALVVHDRRIESSKLHALLGLLDDTLPLGHRVLIFSTFTTLLELTRVALEQHGVSSLYLDGSTPAAVRGELVERFQSGEGQVFLISLKAGGTGLNLTAADYVVHLDLWWNPAAQDQASDRAHRIGQTRPVTIVKLIAEDTIEDRVLELQAHKRWLASTVLTHDGEPAALDHELLEALLN